MSFVLNPYAFLAAGGDFESIATVTVGSGGAANIDFTSIPSTYQHLQIRMVTAAVTSDTQTLIRFNGDTGSNYAVHFLFGNGSTASAGAGASFSWATVSNIGASQPSAAVCDILDYASTSKATTLRSLWGYDKNGSGIVGIRSSLWTSTSAVTSLRLQPNAAFNFPEHTTAALYGIKGAA